MVLRNEIITEEDVFKLTEICNKLDTKFRITSDDLEVSMFETGAVSNIYRIAFKSTVHPPIVVKVYPQDQKLPFEKITSQLNQLYSGQHGLGPRVLLILRHSIVSECLENTRCLTHQDDFNLNIRETIARKLAKFHHQVAPPIERNTREQYVKDIYEEWIGGSWFETLKNGFLRDCATKNKCTALLGGNLEHEFAFVKNRILGIEDQKIVFSHNDFNHSNILLRDDGEIWFVDFDYSCYFYRGADLGRYFVDCTNEEQFDDNQLIPDSEMRQIIEWYWEESAQLDDSYQQSDKVAQIDHLLAQAKLFVLNYHCLDLIFCLWMADQKKDADPGKSDEFMKFAETCFSGYLRSKTRFQADGSI